MIVRRVSRRGYFSLLHWSGHGRRLTRRLAGTDDFTVLNLHRVTPERNPFWPPLTPELFDDLLGFLKRDCFVHTFAACPVQRADRPTVVLSFDDGYHDFVEYAMPLLEKHGLAANQNIVISSVEHGLPPWEMRLYDFLNAAPLRLLNELGVPGFTVRLESNDDHAKLRFGLALSRHLKNRSEVERAPYWEAIERAMQRLDNLAFTRMMSEAEVREAARIHEIGAQSYAHASMAYESRDYFARDVQQCCAYFRRTLGRPMDVYAFPNGSYTSEQVAFLQERGLRRILLVDERLARRGETVTPRLTIYGDTAAEVRLRALGARAQV